MASSTTKEVITFRKNMILLTSFETTRVSVFSSRLIRVHLSVFECETDGTVTLRVDLFLRKVLKNFLSARNLPPR